MADARAEYARGERHQQYPYGRALPVDGRNLSDGTQSGVSHRPTAVLAAGTIAARASPQGKSTELMGPFVPQALMSKFTMMKACLLSMMIIVMTRML